MKKLFRNMLATTLLTAPMMAFSVPVTYTIGQYSVPGFSASSIHKAKGCGAAVGNYGDTLYMCGRSRTITGQLTGDFDGTRLTGIGGSISVGSNTYQILGGSLGGGFYNSPGNSGLTVAGNNWSWWLNIDGLGKFVFEDWAGSPNRITRTELVLWGQNWPTYAKTSQQYPWEPGKKRGLDIYSYAADVPEPSVLAFFGIGLLGLIVGGRRKPI